MRVTKGNQVGYVLAILVLVFALVWLIRALARQKRDLRFALAMNGLYGEVMADG